MAVACGLTVANLYYCQPLLDLIAGSFGIGQDAASLAVTLTQVGYAAGLLLLVPLGDLLENRRLVTRLLLGTAVALVVAGSAPDFPLFLAFSVLVGVTSVIVQILVPLAAHLAPPTQRGRFVGTVMSGLLLGILLARSAASALAEVLDWRAIYLISAVLMVVLAAVLRRMLPPWKAEWGADHGGSYGETLASVWQLVRTEPVLRRQALAQASMFGAFTAYWTAIAYELIDHHGFSQGEIAVFALVGAGGAAAAPIAGRIADAGYGEVARGIVFIVGSASFVVGMLGQGSWVLLALAAVLLDFCVQAHQVMTQHVIYALRPEARARINTVYMTTVFAGGSLASLLTGWLHGHGGWTAVCGLGIALPLLGFATWVAGRTAHR